MNAMRTAACFSVFAVNVWSASVEGAPPVARILGVRGDVKVQTAQDKSRPARTYGALFAKDTLEVPSGTTIDVVFRKSGRRATVKETSVDRKFQVEDARLAPSEGVVLVEPPTQLASAIAMSVGDLPSIAPGGVSILRGPAPQAAAPRIRPIDNGAVLTTTPAFQWPGVEQADEYEVELLDQYHARQWVTTTAETKLAKTPGKSLAPGRKYVWIVTAIEGDKRTPVSRGSFEVLAPEDAEDVTALAKTDDASLWALAACSYEQLGLVDESIKLYEKLHKSQPTDPVFPAALSDLYERAGDRDLAARARQDAEKLGFEFQQPKPPAK